MPQYNANDPTLQETPLTDWLSSQIELLLDGKVCELTFSHTLLATPAPCAWCHAPIVDFKLASGRWFGANVVPDEETGEPRAVLTSPHLCPELLRRNDFSLEDRDEPEELEAGL